MPLQQRLLTVIIRTFGVFVALILIVWGLLLIVLPSNGYQSSIKAVVAIIQAIHLFVVAALLLTPLSLIKRATTALWYFRLFLVIGGSFVLGYIFSYPFLFVLCLDLVLLGNIWLSYQHWRRRLGHADSR